MKADERKTVNYDVVVIGGGLSGICAAIASARNGAKTALVQERPVLGGNASEEIRMHVCGASCNMTKDDAEETGILQELQLENKRINDSYNYSLWSSILLWKVKEEPNLTLYLNTTMYDVNLQNNSICNVYCYQMTTELHLDIHADIFIDATGNGTLGYMSGAEYRFGSESKAEFLEPHAPEKADRNVMGNTLLFKAVDRGHPVKYTAPEWAYHFTEDQLKYRKHGNTRSLYNIGENGDIAQTASAAKAGRKDFDAYCLDYGYWWIEIPGEISQYEDIRDELTRYVYGVWDHIKNGGDHGAENFDLLWVGSLPGVRESRRLVGDYILTEKDVLSNRMFSDAVAYGGWPIDVHTPGGILDFDRLPNFVYNFPGFYTIPYRCFYSRNIDNMLMAGRNISATKIAMSSTRVMGTCSVGGQAAGTAAGLCVQYHCLPRELGDKIHVLQQQLIEDDCFIPGFTNDGTKDLARSAVITASSEKAGREGHNVINGYNRNHAGTLNYWESNGISAEGESLDFYLPSPQPVHCVQLIFDTNLCRSIKITLSSKRMGQQLVGVPPELVKDYTISLWNKGVVVHRKEVKNNYMRLNRVAFDVTECDRITISFTATNGIDTIRVFEVRIS